MRRFSSDSLRDVTLTALLAFAGAACGGGGGGGGSGGGAPPIQSGDSIDAPGLLSAVAGAGAVRLQWDAADLIASGRSFALFVGTQPGTLFQGAPFAVDPTGSSLERTGLTNGVRYVFGFGVESAPGVYTRVGSILRARPQAPLYVDAASSAVNPDGLTPATAFPDPISAILTAQQNGGGNVWLRGGSYAVGNLPLFAGVDLYGGFGSAFDLASIDRTLHPSVLSGALNQITLEIQGGNPGCVVDGLRIDNQGVGLIGLEADDTDVYLREVDVVGCRSRGVKLFTSVVDRVITAELVGVRSMNNGGDGLFVQGAFECDLDNCVFSGNAQEGAEFDDLVGPDGVDAGVDVRGTLFFGNGTEGLDLDLAAPPLAGPNGSTFQIAISDSRFEANRAAGLLLDVDFELVNGWAAAIELRGLTARANAAAGIALDLDWTSSAFVQRLNSSANGGDGLTITSESRPGLAVVSSSALVGNGGFGLRAALGQVPVLASHSIFAGNQAGGFASSTVLSTAASCAAWLQPNAFTNVAQRGCVTQNVAAQALFQRVPAEYLSVVGANGARPILASNGSLVVGDTVELGDDGIARTVTALSAGGEVVLAPAPTFVPTPAGLARFGFGAGVDEDYHLAPGSIASGAGMAMPGAAAVDAGVFGSPSGGAPGAEALPKPQLFRMATSSFAIGQPVTTLQTLDFGFVLGNVAPASVNASSVRVLSPAGATLAAGLSVIQGRLQLAPPAGGWPVGGNCTIEIHSTVRATDGRSLAAPVSVAFRAQ